VVNLIGDERIAENVAQREEVIFAESATVFLAFFVFEHQRRKLGSPSSVVTSLLVGIA
jgi:hypothetical protein